MDTQEAWRHSDAVVQCVLQYIADQARGWGGVARVALGVIVTDTARLRLRLRSLVADAWRRAEWCCAELDAWGRAGPRDANPRPKHNWDPNLKFRI